MRTKHYTILLNCLCFLGFGIITGKAQNLIQNGGFESQNPAVGVNPPTFRIFPVSGLPGWSTTASDQQVEVWSSGFSSSSGGPVYTIPGPDGFYPNGGQYFAELNANVVSTLYQTVSFATAGAISYSFWHRGRSGVDTMALQIQELVNGNWQQIFYQPLSTGQTWTHYQGRDIAIVKPGQQLRFNFVSVNGSTTSIGNFLDNVAFGLLVFPDTAPPEPEVPPGTPEDPSNPVAETSPELQLDAMEGLSYMAAVTDQLLAQSRQIGSLLYNRFALVRASRQNPPEEQNEPASVAPDPKEVKESKQVVSPGKSFTASINGQRTSISSVEHLPWDLWGQGSGILSEVPSVNSIPGQHNAGGAFLVGIDYYLTRNLTLGIYSGYLVNRQNFTGLGGGSSWSDGLAYGGYLSYSRPQGGFYADAAMGGGGFQTSVNRPINLLGANYGSASSRPTSTLLMMSGDFGYDLKRGNWTLGPIGMFQYTQMNTPSVQETDPYGLNLKINNQQQYSLYSSLGGPISYKIQASKSVSFLPEIRCFWNHEFYNAPRSLTGAFQPLPSFDYSYTDTLNAPNTVTPSVGVTALLGKNLSSSLFYSASMGSGSALQEVTLSANLNF
ncbi:MAG: autotransporter outer membrane beta-barrel domain-containing protein [bacterium]